MGSCFSKHTSDATSAAPVLNGNPWEHGDSRQDKADAIPRYYHDREAREEMARKKKYRKRRGADPLVDKAGVGDVVRGGGGGGGGIVKCEEDTRAESSHRRAVNRGNMAKGITPDLKELSSDLITSC